MQAGMGWKEILLVVGTVAAAVLCGYITYWFFKQAIKSMVEKQERR
jgi:uncharacterized membrane protein YczE